MKVHLEKRVLAGFFITIIVLVVLGIFSFNSTQRLILANHLLHLKDGEEALAYIFDDKNVMPRLILLDLKMPKIDGIEVLRRLKSDDKKKVIPVVMLTSSKEESDIVETYKLGVNAYIVKPVDFNQFVKAVTELGLFWLVLNQPPVER